MEGDNVTHEKIKKMFHYDMHTGIVTWRIKSGTHINPGDVAGCLSPDGYIYIGLFGRLYPAHRLAWFYTHGYFPEKEIDHIDRVKHNNCISNLREVSRQCNARNTGNQSNNTSGVKGVIWHKRAGKWMACIKVNGDQKYLGIYNNFHNAVCARLMAEQCLNWEGCDSVSPAFKYVKTMTNV